MAERKPKDDRRPDKRNPEYENFQRFLEGTLRVPKEGLDKERKRYERERGKKRSS